MFACKLLINSLVQASLIQYNQNKPQIIGSRQCKARKEIEVKMFQLTLAYPFALLMQEVCNAYRVAPVASVQPVLIQDSVHPKSPYSGDSGCIVHRTAQLIQ